MQKISEEKYIINYDELIELVNLGYDPIGDLKKVLKHTSLLKNYKEIPVMIKQDEKIIDTYLYYKENPYPWLYERHGISEVELKSREQWRETFGYKYQ